MADGLCAGDPIGGAIEQAAVEGVLRDDSAVVANVARFFSDSAKQLFMCDAGKPNTAFLTCEEDCMKKRCVDRYDSSESSDSGVAVLSCTDCSGSSTASSDITDPGSPFSTTSSHSEDSASQPAKMPPTQTAHHPPWSSWPIEETAPLKRSVQDKTAFPKRQKASDEPVTAKTEASIEAQDKLIHNNNNINKRKLEPANKFQQGKITEYFKTQVKSKPVKKVEAKGRKNTVVVKKLENKRKVSTPPRKILPAPSKMPEKIVVNNHSNLVNFAPVTLTAVGFPPNLAYLHTKAPKPPDNIFVQQFATINDKIGAIPCLNVLQPVQKIATLNNFNCVKLNATVVPIVKLNTLSQRLTTPIALSVETAMPTVLTAKAKPEGAAAPKPEAKVLVEEERKEEFKDDKCFEDISRTENTPESPDSGLSSSKECLVVSVSEPVVEEEKKSPILSQPKTIRFPVKRDVKEDVKDKNAQSTDGQCRWAECNAQFTTSGALLEHLQVKHVISQAEQEHFVCLWLGCKVHGRTSCSRSWLERHVLAHAGTKPFRCIVDGCGQRFNSQLMLERHVNGHFNSDGSQNGSAKKTTENGCVKMFKRNGKKIRFRRQPWSARMFDFIDSGIMEGLQHKLLTMTQRRTLGNMDSDGTCVNLQAQIIARKTDPDGCKKVLVRWHPVEVCPEEWVHEDEFRTSKMVSIPKLTPSGKDALKPSLFPPGVTTRKHRRKPTPKRT